MDTQNTAQVSLFIVWSSFVCFVIFVNQFEHKMPHLKKKGKKEIKQNEKERKEKNRAKVQILLKRIAKDLTYLPIYKFESDMK